MFNNEYAKLYDLIYLDKPYEEECRFLADVFHEYNSKDILDIACGTGEHLRILDNYGYNVYGIDSSQEMLDLADKKLYCPLKKMDMINFNIDRQFDAVISMFNSIGYVKDLDKVFKNVWKHLNKEGIFIFDFWNKDANDKIPERYKESLYGNNTYPSIKRGVYTKILPNDVVEKEFIIYNLTPEGITDWKTDPIREIHTIQTYNYNDVKINLEMCGFSVEMFPFMEPYTGITSNDKVVQCIAEKV